MRKIHGVPVTIRLCNADGVHAPKRTPDIVRRALMTPGDFGVPDFVLFSEVSPVSVLDIARTVDPAISVVQEGRSGSPEAGVAIAALWPIELLRLIVGSPATSEGGGIRMRPLLGALCGRLRLWAVHAPPGRAPRARALFLSRVRPRRHLVGGDMNRSLRWVQRLTGRKVRGAEVMCLVLPPLWRATAARPVNVGTSHPALDIKVWVPRRLLKSVRPVM